MKQAPLNAGTMGHRGWDSPTIDLPHGVARGLQAEGARKVVVDMRSISPIARSH